MRINAGSPSTLRQLLIKEGEEGEAVETPPVYERPSLAVRIFEDPETDWCTFCTGLRYGKVAANNGNLILQEKEGGEPQRLGNIVRLCGCTENQVEILLPLYGCVIGETTFGGLPIIVRWDGESWRRLGPDPKPVNKPIEALGRFARVNEAKARAEAGPYHFRSRGWTGNLTMGPLVVPSHAATDVDTPSGSLPPGVRLPWPHSTRHGVLCQTRRTSPSSCNMRG